MQAYYVKTALIKRAGEKKEFLFAVFFSPVFRFCDLLCRFPVFCCCYFPSALTQKNLYEFANAYNHEVSLSHYRIFHAINYYPNGSTQYWNNNFGNNWIWVNREGQIDRYIHEPDRDQWWRRKRKWISKLKFEWCFVFMETSLLFIRSIISRFHCLAFIDLVTNKGNNKISFLLFFSWYLFF